MKNKLMLENKLSEQDLGFADDSLTAIIDLLHIEIHAFKSFNQTKDKTWLEINNRARIERTELLELICDSDKLNTDGELWCFNKHSLRVVGSYIELGNRVLTKGDYKEAEKYFDKAGVWLGVFLIKNNLKGGQNGSIR